MVAWQRNVPDHNAQYPHHPHRQHHHYRHFASASEGTSELNACGAVVHSLDSSVLSHEHPIPSFDPSSHDAACDCPRQHTVNGCAATQSQNKKRNCFSATGTCLVTTSLCDTSKPGLKTLTRSLSSVSLSPTPPGVYREHRIRIFYEHPRSIVLALLVDIIWLFFLSSF